MGCLGCEGTYEIGLPQCPHCGTRSPMYTTKEDAMPTITSGGASNAAEAVETEDVAAGAAEAAPEVEAASVPADAETVTGERAESGTDHGSASTEGEAQLVGEFGPELALPQGWTAFDAPVADGPEAPFGEATEAGPEA